MYLRIIYICIGKNSIRQGMNWESNKTEGCDLSSRGHSFSKNVSFIICIAYGLVLFLYPNILPISFFFHKFFSKKIYNLFFSFP